jgi:hypothetical protein
MLASSQCGALLRKRTLVGLGLGLLLAAVLSVALALPASAAGYRILGSNDLGMHCIQSSYSGFMVLPPANTVVVQIFRRGGEGATLVTSGVTVSYNVVNNTTSTGKTDFWQYAAAYGFSLQPNVGITGNGLSGTMTLTPDHKAWTATAIPVTPYNDANVWNPYQHIRVVVRSAASGAVLASTNKIVLPVSDEMRCDLCHGKTHTAHDILATHDAAQGTQLATDLDAGVRHACNECHADPILNAPGKAGVNPLSQDMHAFHAGKMSMVTLKNKCNACHPGPRTQCLRGAMARAGITCTNSKCHGSMAKVASSQANGRIAWLQEPTCRSCHGAKHAPNANTLYRNSVLKNGPEDMNGFIRCESCHGSPHSEWKSRLAADNALPISVQGVAGFIKKCTACHSGSGHIHH